IPLPQPSPLGTQTKPPVELTAFPFLFFIPRRQSAVAVACPFVCHFAAMLRYLLLLSLSPLPVLLFVISQRSGEICCCCCCRRCLSFCLSFRSEVEKSADAVAVAIAVLVSSRRASAPRQPPPKIM